VSNTSFKNDYYTVQKLSEKTGDFEDLEVINEVNKTAELQHFTTYDSRPTEGGNFYRLKLTQMDGSTKFSETKKVVFGKMSGVNIFPNPSSEYVDIDLSLYKGQTVNIYLYNTFGHQVAFKTVENVEEIPVRLDISTYTAGNFLLRVTAKGKRDVTKQVIIGR
jgi:Secretion system C-terminal sorting domain